MKKKNLIGAGFLILAILAAIPLGTSRSFARLRESVQDEYYYDSTGYSVYTGLGTRAETGRNLLTLAEKYVDDSPELRGQMNELEFQVKYMEYNFGWDNSLVEQIEANRQMGEAAQALAAGLEEIELAEKDRKYPRQLLADLDAEEDKLERSSYNDEARAYNAKLEKFPVSLLKGIAGVKALGVFEK